MLTREQEATHDSKRPSGSQGLRAVEDFKVVVGNWRMVATFAVAGLLISVAAAFLIPREYTSLTRLMPPQTQTPLAMMSAVSELSTNPMVGKYASELLGVKSTSSMFLGVLQSRAVQDRIIDKFDLRKAYRTKYYFKARERLAKNTSLVEDRKSGIITIQVTDRDRQRSADIAKEYVLQLDRTVVELNTSAARQERVFLEKRLAEVRKDLDESAVALSRYSSEHGTMDLKEQAKTIVGAAAELQGQVIAAQTELEGLRQIYTNENVRVRAARARVDNLKKEFAKLTGSSSDGLTADQPFPSLRRLPIVGTTYTELYRTARVNEAVFETLTKQYEMAKVEEAREVPPVRVLDVADLPEKHSFPPRLMIMVSGLLLGVVSGTAFTLLRGHYRELPPQSTIRVAVRELQELRHLTAWKAHTVERG